MLRKVNIQHIKAIYFFKIKQQVVITTDTGLPLIVPIEQLRAILKSVEGK
tara:strand:- start:2879 stop:3028 length:150 start_codon:yes stop_codon:yes gene_type:complete